MPRDGELLPRVRDPAHYSRIYTDDDAWLPGLREICVRHGLAAGALARATLGSNPVYRTGDAILKLYPPFEDERTCELAGLRGAAAGGLPVPAVLATGTLEGWKYAVFAVVEGVPALDVWPRMSPVQRAEVARQVGELLARLHACPVPADLPGDWDVFLRARLDSAEAHHGAEEPWRSWIAARVADFRPSPRPHVLLHADITEDHVLLRRDGDHWRVHGLIDFGDARPGHPFYDLVAPLAFYAFGEPPAARALLDGYGLSVTPAVLDELTTWCLLHEFGRLQQFLERHAATDGAGFECALWGAA